MAFGGVQRRQLEPGHASGEGVGAAHRGQIDSRRAGEQELARASAGIHHLLDRYEDLGDELCVVDQPPLDPALVHGGECTVPPGIDAQFRHR